MPSISDIKDGLLKMILYSNLSEVTVDGREIKSIALLNLTSPQISGGISSEVPVYDRAGFLLSNKFSQKQIKFIDILLEEAKENGFLVSVVLSTRRLWSVEC